MIIKLYRLKAKLYTLNKSVIFTCGKNNWIIRVIKLKVVEFELQTIQYKTIMFKLAAMWDRGWGC